MRLGHYSSQKIIDRIDLLALILVIGIIASSFVNIQSEAAPPPNSKLDQK